MDNKRNSFTNKTYRNGKNQVSRPVVFMQQSKTRFAQMTLEQLQEKSRDNKLRRCILQNLILESNFAAHNSKFYQLCVRGVAPCFLKTDGPRREFRIRCADGVVLVKVNLFDACAQAIWQKVQPILVCDAQALFGIDHNIQIGDPILNRLLTQVTYMLESAANGTNTLRVIASTALALWNFARGKADITGFGLLLAQICLSSDLFAGCATVLYDMLAPHVMNAVNFITGGLFAQGEFEPLTSFVTVLSVLFGTLIMKQVPKGSWIDECVGGAVKMGNLARGMTNAWSGLEKIVMFIFEKIYTWQYGVPSSVTEMSQFVSGTQDWYVRVQKLVSLTTPDEISVNSEFCSEIEDLYREGLRMNAMVQEYKLDARVTSAFQTHLRVVNSYYDKAQSSGAFRGGPRVEPIVIHMHGESGVGKSGMTYPLAIDLLKIEGIPGGDYSREIYMRAIEQDFWDGYRNQRVCIYDDFGQMRDSQAKPNLEFMEIIRTGNLAPYPLHMASLEEKAKTYFKSRAIILTSNMPTFRPESLSHPDAVRRRVDLSVDVHIRKEFQKIDGHVVRLDPLKVERILGEKISMEVYELWLCDPQTGHHLHRQGMSYDAFRKMAQELYRNRFERSKALFDFLQSRADTPLDAQVLADLTDAVALRYAHRTKLAVVQPMEFFRSLNFGEFVRFMRYGHVGVLPFMDLDSRMDVQRIMAIFFNLDPTEQVLMYERLLSGSHIYKWREGVEKLVMAEFQKLAKGKEFHPLGHESLIDRDIFLSKMIQSFEVERAPWSEQILYTLEDTARRAAEWFVPFLEKVKTTAIEHPWLTAVACIVPIAVAAWLTWRKPIGFHFRKRACQKIVSEMGNSGDFTSVKPPVVRTELGVSGDVKTIRPTILKTEIGASGDFTSVKPPVIRTEGVLPLEEATALKNAFKGNLLGGAAMGLAYAQLFPECEVLESEQESEEIVSLETQLQVDANAFALSKKILNSTYNIELEIDGAYTARMKLIMIVGRIGLVPAHLLPYLKKSTQIHLWNHTKKQGHYFPTNTVQVSQVFDVNGAKKDQMLLAFPVTMHDHADLLSSIADSTTMSSFQKVSAVLVTPSDIGPIMRFGMISAMEKGAREYIDGSTVMHVRERYEYTTLETTKGDCGSVLIAIGSKIPKKILGIHVAGTVGLGVATPLNIRDIKEALSKLPVDAQVQLDMSDFLRMDGSFEDVKLPNGNFLPVGKAIYRVSGATKTQLRPSLIQGQVVPVTTIPSALKPIRTEKGIVDPMQLGLEKAGQIPPHLDDALIDAAINDMKRIVNSNIDDSTCRILTNMESVTGIEGNEFIGPIKRSSSAGFPWMQQKSGSGKSKWLGNMEYRLDEEVEKCMEERIQMARENKRMHTLWTDTLKDERRPIEKVLLGKTRVFSAGPMDFTLVFRKYFLAFAGHVAQNRIGNEISVGTNPYSDDWSRTAAKVLRKGPKVIAGDFSNFDGTLVLQILEKILDIVQDYYNDGAENAQIRRILWREVTNSIHICGDDVYMWTHSQPSGCPITAILNSIYNSVSMRYVWQLIMRPLKKGTMVDFNKHVSMVSYGDDNLVNISDEVIEDFNQITIAQGYTQIGMTYTDETKSGSMVPYRSLKECAYLKRTFVWDDEEMLWLAPLDINVVLEMANWIRGDLDQEACTSVNIEMSCFELTLHGREVFDRWVKEYHRVTSRFSVRPMILTFDEYRSVEAQKYGRLG